VPRHTPLRVTIRPRRQPPPAPPLPTANLGAQPPIRFRQLGSNDLQPPPVSGPTIMDLIGDWMKAGSRAGSPPPPPIPSGMPAGPGEVIFNQDDDQLGRGEAILNGGIQDGDQRRITAARLEAEQRFPFIKEFRDMVNIAPAIVRNKGGFGEYVEADAPNNPMPGKPTITIGANSYKSPSGIANTIIADMVHAAAKLSPELKKLKKEMVRNFSKDELSLAKRRYEEDFKGLSGSDFATFGSFLNTFWSDRIVQHLLLPENSEIAETMRSSPNAIPPLNAIKQLFETGIVPRYKGTF